MQYGLIGKPLGHSMSPKIHALLGNNDYELLELEESELKSFLEKREFKGINVTIPYKEKVLQYLDVIDDNAKRIGCVNTIVNINGVLHGYNTDYDGFKELIISSNIELKDKNVLILGSGGTSKTALTVLKDLGVSNIKIVSRTSSENKITYEDALKESATNIIVNTTPVGMYPNTAKYPLTVHKFNNLEAVVDVIYNPLNSRLLCFARNRRVKAVGGLKMLVSQAIKAHELFFNSKVEDNVRKEVYNKIYKEKVNIVLIGMPGCGKSTIAKYLAKELNRELIDLDKEIEKSEDKLIKDIFAESGEDYFRDVESNITKKFAKLHGQVISCGGGIIKNSKNIEMLRQNGLIIFVNRSVHLLEALKSDKRPLAKSRDDLEKLYQERKHLYFRSADKIFKNNGLFLECAKLVKEWFDEVDGY